MRLKTITSLIVTLSLLMAGCSDEATDPKPEDADADDNFITSVVLTVGDKSYSAKIVENNITIAVPYTVSLNGAKAEFIYTKSATIIPDPATITDWDNERQFRVTSYNGETNDFKYLVVKKDIQEEGDVVLKTQAEVKAFADKGVTILKGNLTIGEADGENEITGIELLTKLKEIEGNVTINNTYKGADLTGLDNVTKLGGLYIGTMENVSTASGLYFAKMVALEEVTGDIVIRNDVVQWFEAEKLTKIGGSFVVNSLELTSIKTPALMEIGKDFEVQGSNTGKAGSTMAEVSMPGLTTLGGQALIKNMAKLKAVKFEKLTKAGAFLLPTIPFDFETIELPVLSEVTNDIQFISNVDETTIGGATMNTSVRTINMNALTQVGGTLSISRLSALEKLPDLGSLRAIKGVSFFYSKKVKGTIDFSKITFGGGAIQMDYMSGINKVIGSDVVNADLSISSMLIPELQGFSTVNNVTIYSDEAFTFSIKKVRGNLYYNTNGTISAPYLEEVEGYFALESNAYPLIYEFPKLRKIGGQFFSIAYPQVLKMDNLEEVGTASEPSYYITQENYACDMEPGSLYLGLPNITDPEISLPKLKRIGGKGLCIDLQFKGSLKKIKFPALETIDGYFHMTCGYSKYEMNKSLTQVELPVLKSVKSVDIRRYTVLSDFSMFKNLIPSLSNDTWSVTGCGYNPTYQQMAEGKYTAE